MLDNPRLQVSVCNPSNAPIEAVQTLEAPGIVKKDAIWWGTTWFMQTPLENIGEDFAVVVRLMHGPPGSPMGTSGQVPLSRYRIVKEDIDTGRVTLKFVTSTAGNFSPRPEAPGSNGNRLTFNAKKPLGSPEIFSSYLEGEIEIVKSFREYDLMPLGRGINTEKKPFQFTPGVLNEPWTKDALKPVSKSSGKPNLLNSALKPLPRLRKFPAYSGTSVSRNPTPGRPRVYPPGESPSISPRPAAARSPMRRLVPKESAASTRATSMDDFTMPTVGGSGAPPRPKSLRVTPSSTPSTPATATASPSAVATSTATIDSPSPLPPKPERPPSLRTSPNLTIDTSIPGVKSAGIAVSVASPMNAQAGDDASRPLSVGPPKPDKPVKPPSVRKMDLHSSASGSN